MDKKMRFYLLKTDASAFKICRMVGEHISRLFMIAQGAYEDEGHLEVYIHGYWTDIREGKEYRNENWPHRCPDCHPEDYQEISYDELCVALEQEQEHKEV